MNRFLIDEKQGNNRKIQKRKSRNKIICLGIFLMFFSALTGCGLIDRTLTDMGIVKDENGGRRFITEVEMKKAELSGRLNVDYKIVSSKVSQDKREVKVVIEGDPLKVTKNDIELISELVWLEVNENADFTKLDILIYDRIENIKDPYTIGKGTFTTKGKFSSPSHYIYLSNYNISYEYGNKKNGLLPMENPAYLGE